MIFSRKLFLDFFIFFFVSYSLSFTILQLLSMHKEMQKQMNAMVSVPVTKEGKRLEGSLGRNMEKVVKAHTDALWARLQEENAKQEKLERDRTQQITNLISNYVNKDMVSILEKIIKKEISSIGTTITRSISQVPILTRKILLSNLGDTECQQIMLDNDL